MPSPQTYDVSQSFIIKHKRHDFSKNRRITLPNEIQHLAKREGLPGPGTYEPSTKEKLKGAFNLKDEKEPGFIVDA